MALFGEFLITNEYDLSLELQSLVKSLSTGKLRSQISMLDISMEFNTDKLLFDDFDSFSTIVNTTYGRNAGESIQFQYSKPLADSQSIGSTTTKNTGKLFNGSSLNFDGIAEGHLVAPTDTITSKNIGKALSTSYSGVTETITERTIGKSLLDTPLITDLYAFDLDRSFADSFNQTDVSTNNFTKYLNNTTLNFNGSVEAQSITPTDSKTLSASKALADSAVPTDSTALTFSRTLTDTVYMIEALTVETTALNANKYMQATDVNTVGEAGSVWINPYQGQDYYSEQYSVGLSATFAS